MMVSLPGRLSITAWGICDDGTGRYVGSTHKPRRLSKREAEKLGTPTSSNQPETWARGNIRPKFSDGLSNFGLTVRLYGKNRVTGLSEARRNHDTVFGGYLPPRELRPLRLRGRSDGSRNRRPQRSDDGCWGQGFCWRPATGKQRE